MAEKWKYAISKGRLLLIPSNEITVRRHYRDRLDDTWHGLRNAAGHGDSTLMTFTAIKAPVSNRGKPPDSFLTQLVEWGRLAAEEIFAPNPNPADIYTDIKPILGPWVNLLHRRAAMLEAMRVVAGFESSWNWKEGVDVTNKTSLTHLYGQETGIFQVSFDSTLIDSGAMKAFAIANGIGTVGSFISEMKANHALALEYFARLSRINIRWDGPLIRHEVDKWLSREAVTEFEGLLT